MVVEPALVISCLSLIVSVGSALVAREKVKAARRAAQLQMFEGIFRDIRQLDSQFLKHTEEGSALDPAWRFEFFNTLEFLAYLINHEMIETTELVEFFKIGFKVWARTFEKMFSQEQVKDSQFFPEFKKIARMASLHAGDVDAASA